MSDYKEAKEAFVAGNAGGSIASINLVSLTALSGYTLYAALSSRLRPSPILDYATAVLPLLLGVTLFASHPVLLNATLLIPAVLLTALRPPARPRRAKSAGQWLEESDSDEEPARPVERAGQSPVKTSPSPVPFAAAAGPALTSRASLSADEFAPARAHLKRRHSPTPSTHTHTVLDLPALAAPRARLPFLTVYRAHMMLMTVHCILAIDFAVFPRVFGKCEDFGTSLMDVGVGSFVFSLGLASAQGFRQGNSWLGALVKEARSAAPVLALGLIRVVMVKGTEYPEHVTEYGVHWNFFFTLGLLPFLGTLLKPVRRRYLRWSTLGLLVTAVHQLSLRHSLQAFVLSPARPGGLAGLNKEGLASLPGYLALFLLGLAAGEHVLRLTAPPKLKSAAAEDGRAAEDHHAKRRTELALELLGYAVASWVGLGICRALGIDVSRRLANMSYVLWTLAYNTSFLLAYLLLETYLFPQPEARPAPPLLEAINKNGLAVFLLANLGTGLVNVAVHTMYAGTAAAMGVLGAYSVGVCAAAWALRRTRLKI
ncbi:Glucosaminyl phosphatidylinositol (GlcN-PI) nositol acylation protein [Cryptotrichosporon argae]